MTDRHVVLYLMTRKGLVVLQEVCRKLGPSVVRLVVGARDQAVERDYFEEIQAVALAQNIPFCERDAAGHPEPGVPCIAIAWRWLIHGAQPLIVLHDSLLPRYRGFAPLVSCLINGEAKVGVTALLATERYDEGDILDQRSIDVTYPLKVASAIELVCPLFADIVCRIVEKLHEGSMISARPQDTTSVSYSLWRDEQDYRIDWSRPASELRRFVDAVGHPYRGASCLVDGRLSRILEVEERPDVRIENRTPGKVLFLEEGRPVVVCGDGLVAIHTLKDDATGTSLLPMKRFRVRFT
jgi:methionyl-tRNA formyltransferase